MLRRSVLPALACLLLARSGALAGRVADRPPPLNFVVILVDDLGWRDLGCQGSKFYRTPHIDRLASQGMRFTDGYAAASICSPTRAALMTGRSPARLGVTDWIRARFQRGKIGTPARNPTEYVGGPNQKLLCPPNPYWLELDEVTLAEALQALGYVTCHIGKWHLGDDGWYPQKQGFDFNFGGCDYGQPPSYFDPYANKNLQGIPHLPPRKKGEFLTDREGDEAAAFIRKNKDRPFFLHLAPYAVHTPIQGKKDVVAKYQGKSDGGQKNATYAALVESVDDAVGKVLQALEDAGVADRTLVIFTSDNGGLLGPTHNAPLRSGKGYAYEGGIRVPWIIRWPGTVPPGSTSSQPIITMDIFPTLLEAAGGKLPQDRPIDGVSLVDHLKSGGKKALDRDALFWHFPHYRHAPGPYSIVRKGDWKLTKFYEGPTFELYDLKNDLGETTNLAEKQPEKTRALHQLLQSHLKQVGAKLPRPNPDYAPAKKKKKGKTTAAGTSFIGAVAEAPPDFAAEVLPILKKACFDCHGPDRQRGKLRLDDRTAALKSGVLSPGDPKKSELLRRIALPKGSDEVMPPRGDLLTPRQIAVLRRWIEAGAVWPDEVRLGKHWAYVSPKRPELPPVKDAAWARTPIDRFVLARLEKEGLRPSPEAEPAVLLRRLSLDLIGLPPTVQETDAFLAEFARAPQAAYEAAVERLLASPHFGEKWARPWLDLARYADSHGFQRDDLRDSWAYRDWVIRALNADMPFDRFTLEQVAGDLLPRATLEQKIATGFHRCAPTNVEAGSEPEETRVNQVFDRVNTTGAIWLGTTLECAQCHDHKYDPFTQTDYYRLFAFFNNTAIEADRSNPKVPGSIRFLGPTLTLPGKGQAKSDPKAAAALKQVEKQIEARRRKLAADLPAWEKAMADSLKEKPRLHPLEIADFESTAASPHRKLEDGSILLTDDPPDKDTYLVTVRTDLAGITGFKLETLTHPSLPGNGPGRGDPDRPNFVLNTFAVQAAPAVGKAEPVRLTAVEASFAQKNFDPAGAVDADAKTAWAINPQFHKDHWAVFRTDRPLGKDPGTTLTFRLVQNFGKGRTIGRFRLSALTGNLDGEAVPERILAALALPAGKRSPAQSKVLLDFRLQQDDALRKLLARREQLQAGPKIPPAVSTLVMQELAKPRPTAVMLRGNWQTPGKAVLPGVPALLNPLTIPKKDPKKLDRTDLARWLTSRDNPLTARVMANRWWAEIFGQGIVATVEDFGIKGEPPTHPDLLDWLAVEYQENGWSLKTLLRQIVLSATYRQSARLTPELREKDDRNRLLARGPRARMTAEMIRDNALAAAGLLSRKQFGPPVKPPQPDGLWTRIGGARVEYVVSPGEDRYRRGIYVVWKRSVPYPSFVAFDATARYACTVKRSRSNTPLQALTLLNDPVYVEAALGLARRVLTERTGADADARLDHAFRTVLTRSPRPAEASILRGLLRERSEAARADPKAARSLVGSFPLPPGTSVEDFAAWYAVSAALLNLDETITK